MLFCLVSRLRGYRHFREKTISRGVFEFDLSCFVRANKQDPQYTAPPNCEALLVEMQAKCDREDSALSSV